MTARPAAQKIPTRSSRWPSKGGSSSWAGKANAASDFLLLSADPEYHRIREIDLQGEEARIRYQLGSASVDTNVRSEEWCCGSSMTGLAHSVWLRWGGSDAGILRVGWPLRIFSSRTLGPTFPISTRWLPASGCTANWPMAPFCWGWMRPATPGGWWVIVGSHSCVGLCSGGLPMASISPLPATAIASPAGGADRVVARQSKGPARAVVKIMRKGSAPLTEASARCRAGAYFVKSSNKLHFCSQNTQTKNKYISVLLCSVGNIHTNS